MAGDDCFGIDDCRLQRLQRSEAGAGEPFQLIVETEARRQAVGTGEKAISRILQIVNCLQGDLAGPAEFLQ